jgi:Predicted glycosyltransferases
MKLAVYTLTRDRLADTKKAFAGLREMAGVEFDHFVLDNGSTDGTSEWLAKEKGKIYSIHYSYDNKGQCIASNILLDEIKDHGSKYDFILRYDNDIIPQSPSFVKSLIEASKALGPNSVVSPTIEGLLNPPEAFGEKKVGAFTFGFVEILGGACRLMPAATLKDFRFTEHGNLSLGEAAKFADHCQRNNFPMAYVKGIKVLHDTAAHVKDNAEYFQRRKIEEYIPYGL